MPKLLIIADDLTGANDTGVQFAKKGISTLVLVEIPRTIREINSDCQVLVINTESRHIDKTEAAERSETLIRLESKTGRNIFRKRPILLCAEIWEANWSRFFQFPEGAFCPSFRLFPNKIA